MNKKLTVSLIAVLLVTLSCGLFLAPASAGSYDTIAGYAYSDDYNITGVYGNMCLYSYGLPSGTSVAETFTAYCGLSQIQIGLSATVGGAMYISYYAWDGTTYVGYGDSYYISSDWNGQNVNVAMGQNGQVWQFYYNDGSGWSQLADFQFSTFVYASAIGVTVGIDNEPSGYVSCVNAVQYQVNGWSWYDAYFEMYGSSVYGNWDYSDFTGGFYTYE